MNGLDSILCIENVKPLSTGSRVKNFLESSILLILSYIPRGTYVEVLLPDILEKKILIHFQKTIYTQFF